VTNHDHERALDLIMRRGPEDLPAPDAAWLESHLAACPQCAQYADDFNHTGRLLRSVAVTASPRLVASTQQRIRTRALQMREQQTRMVLIAISFCIGAMSSALSAWMWWRFGGWVVERLSLPVSIVAPGIFLFLLLPAVVIAAVMLAFPQPIFEGRFMAALARGREGDNQ
jgi:anti-sigma factor RsiW